MLIPNNQYSMSISLFDAIGFITSVLTIAVLGGIAPFFNRTYTSPPTKITKVSLCVISSLGLCWVFYILIPIYVDIYNYPHSITHSSIVIDKISYKRGGDALIYSANIDGRLELPSKIANQLTPRQGDYIGIGYLKKSKIILQLRKNEQK